jgi:hypothetical protein
MSLNVYFVLHCCIRSILPIDAPIQAEQSMFDAQLEDLYIQDIDCDIDIPGRINDEAVDPKCPSVRAAVCVVCCSLVALPVL